MESNLRFVKYHGLGNDFVVLERTAPPTPDEARRLSSRGFGIGADGVMVARTDSLVPGAHVAMDLVNSDGSFPEMCGNGIRCFVKYVVDRRGRRENPLVVETPAGLRACHWTLGPDGTVASVRVDMGPARFDLAAVPARGELVDGRLALHADDRPFVGIAVNTGNPHFVIFGAAAGSDARRDLATRYGPILEHHLAFPDRANIEFAEALAPTHLAVTVWERGCGLTWACGTGATATAAAAVRAGVAPAETPICVSLPGGDLMITIAADFTASTMEGPATEVFTGRLS